MFVDQLHPQPLSFFNMIGHDIIENGEDFLNHDSWKQIVERYKRGKISAIELFPHKTCYDNWDSESKRKWRRDVIEILGLGHLKYEVEFGYFRYWGPRQDGTVGWLGPPDFLEDTDQFSNDSVSYQHGWCPGCVDQVLSITGGRIYLMILGNKNAPSNIKIG